MTFKPGPRVHKISFDDDTVYPGLTMRTYGITVDEWTAGITLKEAVEMFLDRLVEWNWETDDGPVPATRQGVGSLDMGDIYQLARVWMSEVTWGRAAVPLGETPADPDGPAPDPEFEAEMPMQPLPANGSG